MDPPKKDFTTAIIVQPPNTVWGPIQQIREKHDKVFNRWMPHVNLIFPFVEHAKLAEGAAQLAVALASFPPFTVTLSTFEHFDHSGSAVMWLNPVTDRPNALVDLQREIEKAFPYCDDQGKKSEHGFTPHITVGQFQKNALEKMKAEFQRTWTPIVFEVNSVYVIKRIGDTPFEIAHEVKFGDKAALQQKEQVAAQKREELEKQLQQENSILLPPSTVKCEQKVKAYKLDNIVDGVSGIEIAILEEHVRGGGTKKSKEVIIALDKSGSMSRSFKDAKQAVISLIENLRARAISHITVVFYSSESSTLFTKDMKTEDITTAFQKTTSGGGTNFADVFGYVASLTYNTTSDVAVVFFSDGQDTSDTSENKKSVKQAFEVLKASLTKGGIASEVHSLGFTPEHDAVLLGKIATLGTAQGSFQYIKETPGIAPAIETTTEVIAGQKLACFVKTSAGTSYKLLLDDAKKGVVFIPQEELQKGDVSVYVGDFEFVLDLEAYPETKQCVIKLKYIETELRNLTSIVVTTPASEVLEKIRVKAEMYDETLNDTMKQVFKLGREDRKKVIQDCLDLKDVVAQFHQLLSEAMTNTLTNDKIATFTSLTYRNVTKKGLQKKLDKLAEKNVGLYQELEKKLQVAVASIDFNELHKTTSKETKELYTCALSMKDFVEALQDQDCMCITLSVGRSQAAIADPSQLEIKAINQTFLTADTFMESAKYAVENAENPTASHGGFQKSAVASLVKGLAREDISGCMPLYISEEHWSVAKQKIKPIMGWMTTLDVMGYAYSQVKIVPFLVLGRALQEAASGSQFKKNQLQMILLTCDQIYKESKGLAEEIKQIISQYLVDPASRTIDIVTNNYVLLGHLLCAVRNGDVKLEKGEINELFHFMIEEEIRRKMNLNSFQPPHATDKYVLFGADKTEFVDVPLKKFDEEYMSFLKVEKGNATASRWSFAIRALLDEPTPVVAPTTAPTEEKEGGETKPTPKEMPKLQGPTFDGIVKFSDKTQQFIDYTNERVAPSVHALQQFKNYLCSTNDVVYDYNQPIFKDVPPTTLLAMYVQNYDQRRNADRREAIKNAQYFDPFKNDNAVTIVKQQLQAIITASKSTLMNEILNREAAKSSGVIGDLFALTEDLYEAAGILKLDVRALGNREKAFHYILVGLARPVPLIKEKLQMLLTGEFKGIVLLSSKKAAGKSVGYFAEPHTKFSRSVTKIWKANSLTIEECTELFPSLPIAYLQKLYHIFKT